MVLFSECFFHYMLVFFDIFSSYIMEKNLNCEKEIIIMRKERDKKKSDIGGKSRNRKCFK